MIERASLFNLRVKGRDAEAIYYFIEQANRPVSYSEILIYSAKKSLKFKCKTCLKTYSLQEAISNNFSCLECGKRVEETVISEALKFLELLSFIKKISEGNDPEYVLQKKIHLPFNLAILEAIVSLEDLNYVMEYKKALSVCLEYYGKIFKSPQEFATFLNANIPERTLTINKNKAENWLLLFSDLGIISRLSGGYIISLDPHLMLELLDIYNKETKSKNRIKLESFLKFIKKFLPSESTLPKAVMHSLQTLERLNKIRLATSPDDISRKYLFDDGRYIREVMIIDENS